MFPSLGESTFCCSWCRLLPGRAWSTASTDRHAFEKTGTAKQPMQKVCTFSVHHFLVSVILAGTMTPKSYFPSPLPDSDMPDHDLEPPRFAQLALERVLQDWNALKSMIMFGSQENKDP